MIGLNSVWLLDPLGAELVARAFGAPQLALAPTAPAASATPTGRGRERDIHVRGVLVPGESDAAALRRFIPATSYAAVRSAVAEANADDSVETIRLVVDSPGGAFDGLLHAMHAIARSKKPIHALALRATSAAYGLAAASGRISAPPDATLGSVGVAVSVVVDRDSVDIANSASPSKRPDVELPEGRRVVQSYLDQAFQAFAEAIGTARGVAPGDVAARYGAGAMFLAPRALDMGLLDRIVPFEQLDAVLAPASLAATAATSPDMGDLVADAVGAPRIAALGAVP